ncbi:hypothetical protein VIN30_11130 [Adlercreutzia sp. R7]|uniref:ABC transporter permease n=1 Tax=Adlercreutzia wanghongyangiae TaxID=3111451 RepID=A0ABU6IKL4_9ACTN|nr:hypothetical protein [Adlercreutzia sp. R7]
MLGKLFSYELRALWKPAAIMLAVMVVAGLAGAACVNGAMSVADAADYGSGFLTMQALSANATVALVMTALFCGFLVWASVVALYVFIVMRFYRTMFTDEGYLTLTLPVRTGTLVMAKFWAAYLFLAVFAFAAMLMYMVTVAVISGGDVQAMSAVPTMMGGWFAFAAEGDAVSMLAGFLNTLITCAYALGLAFASLTLGAWWARRHKVAAAVGIYLGAGWLLSLVFSTVGVLAMSADTGSWSGVMAMVSVVQLLANVAVAVGGVALTTHLVRTKVDLN